MASKPDEVVVEEEDATELKFGKGKVANPNWGTSVAVWPARLEFVVLTTFTNLAFSQILTQPMLFSSPR